MAGRAQVRMSAPARSAGSSRILIIEGRYYDAIGDELLAGAVAELEAQGAGYDVVTVPGALEIPQALTAAVDAGVIPMSAPQGQYAGAVALGCVIRGETSHYDIVCANANHWLMEIAVRHHVPVGNAILTVDNKEQALARASGGRQGKGAEAARACLRLIDIALNFRERRP
jgi:6,7-dimethyl-8-ribityllumazine synthase